MKQCAPPRSVLLGSAVIVTGCLLGVWGASGFMRPLVEAPRAVMRYRLGEGVAAYGVVMGILAALGSWHLTHLFTLHNQRGCQGHWSLWTGVRYSHYAPMVMGVLMTGMGLMGVIQTQKNRAPAPAPLETHIRRLARAVSWQVLPPSRRQILQRVRQGQTVAIAQARALERSLYHLYDQKILRVMTSTSPSLPS